MEHYDISLAVMVLKLCWDIDEAIYLKVNAQARPQGNAWNQTKYQLGIHELGIREYLVFVWFVSVLGLSLSDNAKKNLNLLNEPDYVFYDYFNKTLWATVDELGRERVEVRVSPSKTVPV